MAKIDLVFRQIDERTREVSLALAMEHIRPDAVHILDDVRPFSECVTQMLRIDHDCDYVVYLDADCLILDDMRPFLDSCDSAYVDSYVSDRFGVAFIAARTSRDAMSWQEWHPLRHRKMTWLMSCGLNPGCGTSP
jgi:hypothetical protein